MCVPCTCIFLKILVYLRFNSYDLFLVHENNYWTLWLLTWPLAKKCLFMESSLARFNSSWCPDFQRNPWLRFVQCTLQIRLCWIALELYSAMARFPQRDILTFLYSKMLWHLLTKISSRFSENNATKHSCKDTTRFVTRIQHSFAKVQQDFWTKMQTKFG